MDRLDHVTSYRLGLALTVATALALVVLSGALGVLGAGEADRVYVVVLAVLLLGTAAARLRPAPMAVALLATAGTTVVVTAVALLAELPSPDASVVDIVGITAMFAAGFAVAAWLFRRGAAPLSADRARTPAPRG